MNKTYKIEKEKEIKEWFSEHHAMISTSELPDVGTITVLDWAAPNTNVRAIRYVLIGNRLMVTGDMGSAVFVLTEKADLERIAKYDYEYLRGKMACSDSGDTDEKPGMCFSSDAAKQYLENFFAEDEETWTDDERNSVFRNKLLRMAESASSKSEWIHTLYENEDEIEKYLSSWWEWLGGIGDTYSMRYMSYLIGIKMAYEEVCVK